jgi:hypothetical protein
VAFQTRKAYLLDFRNPVLRQSWPSVRPTTGRSRPSASADCGRLQRMSTKLRRWFEAAGGSPHVFHKPARTECGGNSGASLAATNRLTSYTASIDMVSSLAEYRTMQGWLGGSTTPVACLTDVNSFPATPVIHTRFTSCCPSSRSSSPVKIASENVGPLAISIVAAPKLGRTDGVPNGAPRACGSAGLPG